jgi:hypothetical protein
MTRRPTYDKWEIVGMVLVYSFVLASGATVGWLTYKLLCDCNGNG